MIRLLIVFIALLIVSNETKAQAVIQDDRFNPENWAVIIEDNIELGLLKIIPEKIIESKYFRLSSTDNLVVNSESETVSKVVMSITAYNDENVPVPLNIDNLELQYQGALIDFESENYFDTGLNSTFTFILDDSGSMQGQPMIELLEAFSTFSNQLSHDSMYCRIMWFGSTHEYHSDDWRKCNDSFFQSIKPRGEYGGTLIQDALNQSIQDLASLDSNNVNKYIVVVSDGYDGTPESSLKASQSVAKSKNITTFGYIIGSYEDHTFKNSLDFFISKNASINSFFPSYLSGLSNKIVNENFISVEKEEMK